MSLAIIVHDPTFKPDNKQLAILKTRTGGVITNPEQRYIGAIGTGADPADAPSVFSFPGDGDYLVCRVGNRAIASVFTVKGGKVSPMTRTRAGECGFAIPEERWKVKATEADDDGAAAAEAAAKKAAAAEAAAKKAEAAAKKAEAAAKKAEAAAK